MSYTSTEEVTDILREYIMDGKIPSGKKLQQEALAQSLGVSRTPLRTALANLTQEGHLQYEANRGYFVRSFQSQDITDAYAARAVLEGLAAATAARTGWSDEEVDWVRDQLKIGDGCLADGHLKPADLERYRDMNIALHSAIIKSSGNTWIEELIRHTQVIPFASNRMIVWKDYDIMKRSHDDHHRVCDAIIGRDPQRAEYLMREHIVFAGTYLVQCIEGEMIARPNKPT